MVGIFELTLLSPGRWRVLNTQTQVGYVTYGTEGEVTQNLLASTEAWKRRSEPKKMGSAWRDQIKFEATKEKV